jgi:hypothetical protein
MAETNGLSPLGIRSRNNPPGLRAAFASARNDRIAVRLISSTTSNATIRSRALAP